MKNGIVTILIAYMVCVNIVAFLLMGLDKSHARKHQWRVSEAALFASALVGGSIGAWCGMYAFRHKTKHWYFVIGMPLILTMQSVFLWWLANRNFL